MARIPNPGARGSFAKNNAPDFDAHCNASFPFKPANNTT